MGFASGFNVGWRAVNEAADEREKRRLAEELRGLGPGADATAGQGIEIISPEGQVTRGLVTPGVDLNAARQAYEQAGYQLRVPESPGMGQQFAARAGSRDVGIYGTEAEAERAARDYDIGLTRQRAGVYEGAGQFAEAERLRQLARTEQRAGKEFEAAQKLRGLQITKEERAAQEATRLDNATAEITSLGRPPTMDDIRTIASRNNLSIDQQFKLGQNLTGIAEADAKITAADIAKKIKGKNLDGLLKLHKDDPTFDDNSYFEKSVGKNGQIVLTQRSNDGAVLGSTTFKNAAEATAYLTQQATDPGNVFTWMQASRLKEAQINTEEARANYLRSGGGRSTRPEVSNADIRNYVKDNADTVVGRDPKTGKEIFLRDLPETEQRARAIRFYTGEGGLGTGELPSDVVNKMKPPGTAAAARPAQPAPRSVASDQQIFGRITPQAVVEQAAAAGNPAAQAELMRRRQVLMDRENFPTNTGLGLF